MDIVDSQNVKFGSFSNEEMADKVALTPVSEKLFIL